MGALRERMAVDLRLRGLSPVTQRMYLGCVERFVAHHRRSPTALGEAEIRAFLDHLVREQRRAARPKGAACDIGAFEFACGNGTVDLGEQCDDGTPGDGDCCSRPTARSRRLRPRVSTTANPVRPMSAKAVGRARMASRWRQVAVRQLRVVPASPWTMPLRTARTDSAGTGRVRRVG